MDNKWAVFDTSVGPVEGTDGWSYRLYPPDHDPAAFGPIAPMVVLWQKVRGDRDVPLWKDFDFADFVGWHRWINLLEIVPGDGPFALRHRIWGSGLAEMSRADPTGHAVAAGEVGFDAEDIEFLHQVAVRRGIGLWAGPFFWLDRGNVRQDIVIAPLSTTGEKVDRLISFTHVPGYR